MMRNVTEDDSSDPIPCRDLRNAIGTSDCTSSIQLDAEHIAGTDTAESKQRVRNKTRGPQPERKSTPKANRPLERLGRILTLEIAAKEYTWLWDLRQGMGAKVAAVRASTTAHRVRFGLARAVRQEKRCSLASTLRPPRLVPLFPIEPYTPHSACGHRRPIRTGSLLCCMVCHSSGMDEHPALQLGFATNLTPLQSLAPLLRRNSHETRKNRRRRLYGPSLCGKTKCAPSAATSSQRKARPQLSGDLLLG
jgi:hypothetical protein